MTSPQACRVTGPPKPLRAEVEVLPGRFHEDARDWSELAATRLVAEPLFVESPNRQLVSKLVSDCQRVGGLTWRLTLRDEARWNNGERVTAHQVCQQLARARAARAAALPAALMFKSVAAVSADVMHVETRAPVAHLDRVLACPGLAPRHPAPGVTAGPYTVAGRSGNRIRFRPTGVGRSLDLVRAAPGGCVDLFTRGEVEISGPMSTCPEHWPAVTASPTSRLVPLDILYVLVLPEWLPPRGRAELHRRLDRRRLCGASNGSVVPCERMADLWKPGTVEPPAEGRSVDLAAPAGADPILLLHTDFPGNQELAAAVADELRASCRLNVSVTTRDYDEFIAGTDDAYRSAFRLVLVASPWPHPASMLAAFFFGADSNEEFRGVFKDSVAAEDLEAAWGFAHRAEDILARSGSRFVPLGRVIGCMRSRVGRPWCPPSGWVDYSRLG